MSKQSDHENISCKKTHSGMSHKQFLLRDHWYITEDCDLFHPKVIHGAYRSEQRKGDNRWVSIPAAPGPGVTEFEQAYVNHMYQLGVLVFDTYTNLFDDYGSYAEAARNNPLWGIEDGAGDPRDWEWSIHETRFAQRIPNGKLKHISDYGGIDDATGSTQNDIFWHLVGDRFRSESYSRAIRDFPVAFAYEQITPNVWETLKEMWFGGQHFPYDDDGNYEELRARTLTDLRLARQDAIISQLDALRVSFFRTICIALVSKYPHLIPSGVDFTWGEILNVLTLSELRDIAIRKFMDDNFWRKGFRGELDWLTSVGVDTHAVDTHTSERVGETAALRHAIAHSSSIINDSTFRRAPSLKMLFDDDDRIEVSASNLRCLMYSHINLFSFIAHHISVQHKFPIYSPLRTVSCECDNAYRPLKT